MYDNNGAAALVAAILIIVIFGTGLLLTLGTLFLLVTLHGTLDRIRPQHREMTPACVWLNMIPIFNLGWQFYTVIKVRNSIRREFIACDLAMPSDGFGVKLGISMCVLAFIGMVPFPGILFWPEKLGPFWLLGLPFSLAWLTTIIMYWMKMSRYKRAL